MRALLRSLPLAALLIGTAVTGAAAADNIPTIRDGIATQLIARGLDPAAVRADLNGLTRAERIVHLQSLGVELPTRLQLSEGQPIHALPAGNLAAVQGLSALDSGNLAAVQGLSALDGAAQVRPLPVGEGEFHILPFGPINVIPMERVPSEALPAVPGVSVSGPGVAISDKVITLPVVRPLPSDVQGSIGPARPILLPIAQ